MDTLQTWKDRYDFMRERGNHALDRAQVSEQMNLKLATCLQHILNNTDIPNDPEYRQQITTLLEMSGLTQVAPDGACPDCGHEAPRHWQYCKTFLASFEPPRR